MKKKTVITYGTYDLFHIGHLRLFQRAREYGGRLIVAVSTDDFNREKGKNVIIPYEQRVEIVKSIKCVDRVIPENSWEQKIDDIKKHKVDVLVMGDDWQNRFDDLSAYCEVVYLHRTEGISTTKLKNSIKNLLSIKPDELKYALEILDQIRRDLE